MKLYITYPYGRRNGLSEEECKANAMKAIELGRELILKGHNPYIPHLYHFVHKGWEDSPDEDKYFELVSAWIQDCDAVLIGAQTLTVGMQREIRIAESLGKDIYWDIDEIKEANDG